MQKTHWKNSTWDHAITEARLDHADNICAWSTGQIYTRRQNGWLIRDTVKGIGTVYIKWYGLAKPSITDRIIGSRARREWMNSVRMNELGIAQPEVLCVGTRGSFCSVTGSYLITREIPEADSIKAWLENPSHASDSKSLQELTAALIVMIEKMHAGAFCHWDLKLRNILITRQQGDLQLLPIDSTNGRQIGSWNRRHCQKRDYRFLLADPVLGPYVERARQARAAK